MNIEELKKKTGLDPETLIFNPEKAEKFIAEVQGENPGRIAFLPVRPDWNEAKKVFGYYNPLTGLFYPTDGLNVLLNAFRALIAGKKNEKHFIILDEMNLARVEYYFSDILSLMENMWKREGKEILRGETSQIHPFERCILSKIPKEEENKYKDKPEKKCEEDCKRCFYGLLLGLEVESLISEEKMKKRVNDFNPIPPRIAYPENLVIIGTVNVDETTFSFAPKVLDRAFQLEFTDVYWEEYLKGKRIKDGDPFYNFVKSLQEILKPKNMHFGYRVIDEMLRYLKQPGADKDYDFLLKSKVLPKLHGTEEQIGDVLLQLLAFCKTGKREEVSAENFYEKVLEEGEGGKESGEVSKKTNEEPAEEKEGGDKFNWWRKPFPEENEWRYKTSARKIWQMYQNMKATGYASFF